MCSPKSLVWTDCSDGDFIDLIIKESRQGHDFIPFTGSGISAQSGILMGVEFSDFLAYTTMRVCSKNPKERWDLRTRGWPQYPNEDEVAKTKELIRRHFWKLCLDGGWKITPQAHESPVEISHIEPVSHNSVHSDLSRPFIPAVIWKTPSVEKTERSRLETLRVLGKYEEMLDFSSSAAFSPTSEERITECAIRSLHDWKATLRFLDQVRVRSPDGRLSLGPSDGTVIDSFNAHIISGRRPNFGHTLLAHLAGPLRFRALLTTNFDNLHEEAFATAQRPLRVFEVGVKGRLPAIDILQSQDCLIKLHGGQSETRADLSLDEVPSEDDCKTIRRLFGGKSRPEKGQPFLPAHMLVIGYSAGDMRCVRFIKSLLDHRETTKVFWVCFNESDVAKLDNIFNEDSYRGKLVRCMTRRPDLLLFELHQKLTYHLPASGNSYQYSHRMPPWFALPGEQDRALERWEWGLEENERCYPIEAAEQILLNKPAASENAFHGLLPKWRSDGLPGWWEITGADHVARHGASLCSYLQVKKNKNCVWLELADSVDARAATFEFLRTIALRRGRFQQEHLMFLADTKIDWATESPDDASFKKKKTRLVEHVRRLCERLGIAAREWFLFLYGRDGPGRCAGWHDDYEWPENVRKNELSFYITLLAECGFKIINMPYSATHNDRLKSRIEAGHTWLTDPDNLPKGNERFSERMEHLQIRAEKYQKHLRLAIKADPGSIDYRFHFQHAEELGNELRFIYGLTLFRQSRHFAALCNDAIFPLISTYATSSPDYDVFRYERIQEWVKALCKDGILRNKPGGTLWMFRDVRLGGRNLLECLDLQVNRVISEEQKHPDQKRNLDDLRLNLLGYQHRYHYFIGDWYQRAFVATGNHIPLIEALYHFTQATVHACKLPSNNEQRTVRRCEQSLTSMVKLLRIARPNLKFWMQTSGDALKIFEPSSNQKKIAGWKGIVDVFDEAWKNFVKPSVPAEASERIGQLRDHLFQELTCLTEALKAETGSDAVWQTTAGYVPQDIHTPQAPIYVTSTPQSSYICPKTKVGDHARCEASLMGFDVSDSANTSKSFIFNIDNWIEKGELLSQQREPADLKTYLDDVFYPWVETTNNINQSQSARSIRLYELAALLSEFCFTIARKAKLYYHSISPLKFDTSVPAASADTDKKMSSSEVLRRHWVAVHAVASVALGLCRHLHPFFLDREFQIRIKAMDLSGLALAHLGRYFEAQRRLTGSEGLATKMGQPEAHGLRLRTELRKAEAHLLEARQIRMGITSLQWEHYRDIVRLHLHLDDLDPACKAYVSEQLGISVEKVTMPTGETKSAEDLKAALDKTLQTLIKLHIASLDDAWITLEQAQKMLASSHSTLWWGRLICLQLQCYAELYPLMPNEKLRPFAPESMACPRVLRRRVDHLENILSLLKHGELISPTNLFRRCRFLENAISAMRSHYVYEEHHDDPAWHTADASHPQWAKLDTDLKKMFLPHFNSLESCEAGKSTPAKDYLEKLSVWFGRKPGTVSP